MVKLDPFLIFELLKNVTFFTQKKYKSSIIFINIFINVVNSLTDHMTMTTKKVQDGTMYITSSRFTNLELASLGLNLYTVEKNES